MHIIGKWPLSNNKAFTNILDTCIWDKLQTRSLGQLSYFVFSFFTCFQRVEQKKADTDDEFIMQSSDEEDEL